MAHRAILSCLGPVCGCNRVLRSHEHLTFGVSNQCATTAACVEELDQPGLHMHVFSIQYDVFEGVVPGKTRIV